MIQDNRSYLYCVLSGGSAKQIYVEMSFVSAYDYILLWSLLELHMCLFYQRYRNSQKLIASLQITVDKLRWISTRPSKLYQRKTVVGT